MNVVILSFANSGKNLKTENVDRGKKLRGRKARRALGNIIGPENKVFVFGIAEGSKT